jgi:hypothetical protein
MSRGYGVRSIMLDLSKKIRRRFGSGLISLPGNHTDASNILESQRYAARPALGKIGQELGTPPNFGGLLN